jgi:hypothetical protein
MNLLTIAVFVLIIVIIYVIYKLMSKTTMNVSGFSDASNTVVLPCKKFGTSTNSNYGYSTWLYIDTWESGGQFTINKNVLTRYSAANTPLFQLYLDNDQNNLNLVINGTMGAADPSGSTPPTTPGTTKPNPACTIRNVQLQKWINITMSVYGNTVDMYLDGKLVRTCIMNNLPIALNVGDSLYIGGGYNVASGTLTSPKNPSAGSDGNLQGYISNVVYKANYFTPEEAWNIYSAGYGGAGMFDFITKYKLNFSITNDNQTLGEFSV